MGLTEDTLRTLIGIAARDLGVLERMPGIDTDFPELFSPEFTAELALPGPPAHELFTRLCELTRDGDTYVACLASLHKARLKYRRVLTTQPFPHLDQVGPRGLLQYGLVATEPLAALLIWRKWMYDIDNRAAQDTGYLVEPVIAGALGGSAYPAKISPIKRTADSRRGRQVDCIKDDRAYEFKIRMTIAASGQGRWAEELGFAEDCRMSGYVPVLVVLDPTGSAKLALLQAAFEAAGGICYVGEDAWQHLREEAQPEMRAFLKKYIETPLKDLFDVYPDGTPLPSLTLEDGGHKVVFRLGDTSWDVDRVGSTEVTLEFDESDTSNDLLPGFE